VRELIDLLSMAARVESETFKSSLFSHTVEEDKVLAWWFSENLPAYVAYLNYLSTYRLDKLIRHSNGKKSPPSLLHLTTENYRVLKFRRAWKRADAQHQAQGGGSLWGATPHLSTLPLLSLTEREIRQIAGLP